MATPTYTPLATITLASTDSEIVFSSIPATYRDLILVFNGTGSTNAGYIVNFNSNTTGYTRVGMVGDSGGASSFAESNGAWLEVSTNPSMAVLQVMDYSATDKHKTALSRTNVSGTFVMALAGRWANTAAVTSISLYRSAQTFSAGSTFSLFGVN